MLSSSPLHQEHTNPPTDKVAGGVQLCLGGQGARQGLGLSRSQHESPLPTSRWHCALDMKQACPALPCPWTRRASSSLAAAVTPPSMHNASCLRWQQGTEAVESCRSAFPHSYTHVCMRACSCAHMHAHTHAHTHASLSSSILQKAEALEILSGATW